MTDPVKVVNGKLVFPKLEPLGRIHTHAPACICPKCGQRWRECACPMTAELRAMIPEDTRYKSKS